MNNRKIWVSLVDYDSFSGMEVNIELYSEILFLKKYFTDVIDEIFFDYKEYRDYEVEYGSQARHGSNGTEEIDTIEELVNRLHWVSGIELLLDGGQDKFLYTKKEVIKLLKQQRKNCFKNAKIVKKEYVNPHSNSDGDVITTISKESILNAEIPKLK